MLKLRRAGKVQGSGLKAQGATGDLLDFWRWVMLVWSKWKRKGK
jgi:hypothetical protein